MNKRHFALIPNHDRTLVPAQHYTLVADGKRWAQRPPHQDRRMGRLRQQATPDETPRQESVKPAIVKPEASQIEIMQPEAPKPPSPLTQAKAKSDQFIILQPEPAQPEGVPPEPELIRHASQPRPTPNGRERKPSANGGLIRLENVVKAYETPVGQFMALCGVTLTIDRGEFVAVVGKSGSGKSTLINMLTGIDRPTSGAIYVDGKAIHELSEGEMAVWRGRNIGVIFQFFQLLPMLSCVENVMLPMDFGNVFKPGEREARALHLLEQVDMVEHAYKLPSEVSGGQQQRVAIARALANDPPLLTADEPTGNLDSKTADVVFQLFESLVRRGKTILMVTHDEELASRVTRRIMLADGEMVSEEYHQLRPEQGSEHR
jgi:putative ABC transport system ATP-binding protein